MLSPNAFKAITTTIRIILGMVFLVSCAGKIADPAGFASIVDNYRLLSPPLVWTTAVILPWIEALCGLALVFGRFHKGATLLICLMMIVFIGIIQYNGYRGLNVACGCFSLSAQAPSSIALNTVRNLAILAAGIWLLTLSDRRSEASAS